MPGMTRCNFSSSSSSSLHHPRIKNKEIRREVLREVGEATPPPQKKAEEGGRALPFFLDIAAKKMGEIGRRCIESA